MNWCFNCNRETTDCRCRTCKRCETKMVKGLVTQPLLGHSSARKPVRGDCIYAVSGAVVTCLRCPKCGYSVTSEDLYTWKGSGGVVKQSEMHSHE